MEIYFDEVGNTHQKPDGITPIRRVSGRAFVQSVDGTILMIQPTWSTVWELPGGGIEAEELIRDGIVRECLEETGYAISIEEQPIHVMERNFFSAALGTYFKSLILMYRGTVLSPPANDWVMNTAEKGEVGKISWVRPAELNEANVHPTPWPIITKLRL